MKVVIVGAGLMGVTSAWFLSQRGHEVTVIDREAGPGRDTSFANGSLLTPSMCAPWNAPGIWRALLSSLGRSDGAVQLRMRAIPSLARWGIQFLRNSEVAAFERNSLSNLRLALYSLGVMQSLREETNVDYGRVDRGSLSVFRDASALQRAAASVERLRSHGLDFRILSTAETVALEPLLEPIADQLRGAIHYLTDELGDAHRFCVGLAECARTRGVEFHYGTEIDSLELRSGRVLAAVSKQTRFAADQFVVAAGSYSTHLLRSVGIRLPVRPAKGYSITLEAGQGSQTPGAPLVDDQLHAAIVPLGKHIRVVGTAEFCGYDRTLNPARIQRLMQLLREILPRATYDTTTAKPWCGLRPMSADGVPIIGSTRISNLLVNTGHGHLGWTMAAGSGRMLADILSGESPAIEVAGYELRRFG